MCIRDRLQLHAVEVRRLAYIGGTVFPFEDLAFGSRQILPTIVTGENVGVFLCERARVHRGRDDFFNLGGRRPDVRHVDVVAFGVLAERIVEQVDVHGAGDRVGDHEGRRRQVVHLDVGVDAVSYTHLTLPTILRV